MKPRPISAAIPKSEQQKPSLIAKELESVLRIARATMPYWYRPHYSREDGVNFVRNLGPGSFIVRDSVTVPGGYALTMKISQEAVRLRRKLPKGIYILASVY